MLSRFSHGLLFATFLQIKMVIYMAITYTLIFTVIYSPPGFSVHGILQARILQLAAMSSSRGPSGPKNQTHISYNSLLHWQVGSLQLMPPEKPYISRSLSEFKGFPGASNSRESSCNARNVGSIPGLGRSLGEGNGNQLQYSCL